LQQQQSSSSPPARRSNSSYAATLNPPLGARSAHDFALPSFARKNLLLFLSLSRSPALWSSPPPTFGAQLYLSTNTQDKDKDSSSGRQANRNKCFFTSLWVCTLCVISALLCRQQGTRIEQGRRKEDRRSKKEEGGRGGEFGVIVNSRFSWRLWGKSWFWLLVRFSCCVWRRRRGGGRRGAEGKYS